MSEAIFMRLRHALGEPRVEADPAGLPRAVPDSTEGVAQVCGMAHEQGWRIRLEGRGTWMPADAPADLALTTRGLTRISEIAAADLVATSEAGIPLAALQQALAARHAWLALDPPGHRERSLGSVVATGTAGPARHGFGPVRDHVLGSTIVTGDGRVLKAGGNVVKNVAGYDLGKLQVGGFGAFGVVTLLHLRLRALPALRVTLLARGERDVLTRQARALAEAQVAAAALELCSPQTAGSPEWILALELCGTEAATEAEVTRVTGHSEVRWTRVAPDAAPAFWRLLAEAPLGTPLTLRLGVFPDGLDELLDLLEARLPGGSVSAGAGHGMLRWSGEAPVEAVRELRQSAAQREIPLTLERAPWPFRHALGHFGAYREGVGRLAGKLRGSFDPDPTFPVALEGEDD